VWAPLQGRPFPPETMMHFTPCFRFPPLFSKNFRTLRKIFKLLPFPEKFIDFHPPKFLKTFFLVIEFRISPLFSLFQYISPLFRKNYYSPLLWQLFPPVLHKFTCFLHTLRVFRFPLLWPWCIYASPNARTGRPCSSVKPACVGVRRVILLVNKQIFDWLIDWLRQL